MSNSILKFDVLENLNSSNITNAFSGLIHSSKLNNEDERVKLNPAREFIVVFDI